MVEQMKNIIYDFFDIKKIREYEFRTICGFTFVFEKEEMRINNELSSAEIMPVGIIYDENGEYYFAPLHETDEIDEIVKKFVEKVI